MQQLENYEGSCSVSAELPSFAKSVWAECFECILEVVHEKQKQDWAYHGALRVYVKAVDVSHSNEQGSKPLM